MTPREIIAEAWAITRKERLIRRWGFFSAFFETLLTVKLIGYQLYFLYAIFIVKRDVGLFDDFYWLYSHVPLWLTVVIIVTFLLLLLVEFTVPHMAHGAIIGLAAKSYRSEPVNGGLVLALYNFFPIFAIHEFLILSSWTMALSLCSLTLRYVPSDIKFMIITTIVFVWFLSNILKFMFSFAQPAVVIQKAGIFHAMGQSFKLIVSYLGQVMFLILLLFVISIRVLINAVLVLLVPAIIIGIGLLLANFLSAFLSYLIASIIGMALILVASYFFGYLHVFQETVWTITYLELKKNKDLDVIES